MAGKTVLILVNKQTTVLNFRLEVVEALVQAGYRVVVSVPDGDRLSEIEAAGAAVVRTQFEKNGKNPFADFRLMLTYRKLIRQTGAHVVLTYTIKPNIYGGMAAALCRVPCVANITGLGTALQGGGLIQRLTVFLYRLGFRNISRVFFQNQGDRQFFAERNIAVDRHELLPGSGVNLTRFAPMDYPADGPVEFAFISRIMEKKGIEQYLDGARAIKGTHPSARFHVCGFGDERYEAKMRQLHEEGLIVYHGMLRDVRVMLRDVHCVIHPTFYPEGMSNVLLESAACARPVITTNRSGCREAVVDGVTGFLVKERDSGDLIEAIRRFLSLPYEERRAMGARGREKVQQEFDRQIVVQAYLDVVGELTGGMSCAE